MTRPRLTVARLMFGVALACLILGILQQAKAVPSIVTGRGVTDLGLWPGLVAFGTASFLVFERRKPRSAFVIGFAATGWASLVAYVAFCRFFPEVLFRFVLTFLNVIEPRWIAWLIESDGEPGYSLSLLILGLLLAVPQLIMATLGGGIVWWFWGHRWTTT